MFAGEHYALVSGHCPTGADTQGESTAQHLGWKVEIYPAAWGAHGRKAGPIRNQAMVNSCPDLLVGFLKNNSRGSRGTLEYAKKKAFFPIVIYSINDGEARVKRDLWVPPQTLLWRQQG